MKKILFLMAALVTGQRMGTVPDANNGNGYSNAET